MKNCIYLFEGKHYIYEELFNLIKDNKGLASDILYSKDYDLLQKTMDKLLELKEKGKTHRKSLIQPAEGILEGCSEINIGDYSLLAFIDSGLYNNLDGSSIMKTINIEEYIKRQYLLYKSAGLSEDEATKRCNILKQSWKRILKDGSDLHKILLSIYPKSSYSDVVELTKKTSFAHLSDLIYNDIESQVFKLVKQKHGKISKEYGDDSSPELVKNVNLTAKLNNLEKTITAHFDYIIINPDNSLEIYNIKASHEPHSFWDETKREKYRNEFALMARILQLNGFNIKNIRFNIVPVVLTYNDTYSEVTDINVNKAECYSHNKGAFILLKQFLNAQRFIDSDNVEFTLDTESLDTITKQLGAVFPNQGVKALGVLITIEDYINRNWKYWTRGPQPDTGYSLTIEGVHYDIKDPRAKSENKEVYNIIKSRSLELIDNYTGQMSASGIISQLKLFRRNSFPSFDNYYLNLFFLPYFENTTIKVNGQDKYDYLWSIVENPVLEKANIIMFKNKNGQVNIISLSNLDIDKKISLNNRNNILGFHLSDARASDYQGHELLRSTCGNIETIRTMFLLNEIIPQLDFDIKLGNISVLGGLGTDIKSQTYPIKMISSNFAKIIDVVFSKEDFKVENNLKNIKHISPVDLLINEYWDIMQSDPALENTDLKSLKNLISGSDMDSKLHLINGEVVDSLASAENNEVRILRLEELISKLNTILKKLQGISLNPDNLIKLALENNHNSLIRNCSRLLLQASITLDRLSGIIRISELDLHDLDNILARPLNIANSLIRIVGKLLQDAIHNTSVQLDSKVSDFNLACLKYYRAKGYTSFENALIGDLVRVFKHLYKPNKDELFFKNPYDPTEDLDLDDREFLKKILFIINKIRFLDRTFSFVDENDPGLQNFIKENDRYFWVPLERASSATRWKNPLSYAKDFNRRAMNYCKNPGKFFKELYEGILTEDEEEKINQDIEDMLAYNYFRLSDIKKGRDRLFKNVNYNIDYFETNIQNLVIDYIHKDILEKEMNKMLTRTKGILLYLKLTGESANDPQKFSEVIKYIDDYLKVSVFNKSIMNEDTKKLDARMRPIRKLLTKIYIAANPVAAVRDVVGGFLSNTVRSLTKFKTNIDVKDVMWGYQFVLKLGVHTAMDIDFLDKINTKYLISNINLESPLEGYKTNRGGIRNVDNWLYATLRKPDFLNRMVLFMAQLKHDGSNKAYSIIDNKLVYNWRLDKRFNLLADNDKSDLKAYNEQKALYLSLLNKFNEENPSLNLKLSIETDLPDGYTLNLIDEIKNLADTIYGSYNISTKAKYENLFLGSQLGAFSTWMNGIYDVYFGSRRESSYETILVQKRNDNGELLWIDDLGNITTENTGIPLYADIPLIVQGVIRTLGDILSIAYHSKSSKDLLNSLKTEIWDNPMQIRNLRRLLSDLLVWFIMHEIVENILDPAYEEHKKNDSGRNIVANAFIEATHKGITSSYEEFKGPFPVVDYICNNTKPATWQWSQRFTRDVIDVVVGDQSVPEFLIGMQAFPKSFLDTYKMYVRDTANGISETEK